MSRSPSRACLRSAPSPRERGEGSIGVRDSERHSASAAAVAAIGCRSFPIRSGGTEMSRAYNIVDADGHILEPLDLWDKYLDPKFRDRAPRLVKAENGKECLVMDEHVVGNQNRGIGGIGAVGARQGVVAAEAMEHNDGKPSDYDPHQPCPDMQAH